jgi:hypothetical protein
VRQIEGSAARAAAHQERLVEERPEGRDLLEVASIVEHALAGAGENGSLR